MPLLLSTRSFGVNDKPFRQRNTSDRLDCTAASIICVLSATSTRRLSRLLFVIFCIAPPVSKYREPSGSKQSLTLRSLGTAKAMRLQVASSLHSSDWYTWMSYR